MKCSNPNYITYVDSEKYNGVLYKLHPQTVFIKGGKYLAEDLKKWNVDTHNLIEVPCGKCLACRLNYSRHWANRCYIESLLHEQNWFITLTYDDDHLVYGEKGFATVEKSAISDFVRKVRHYYGHDKNIRYFGCSEYGPTTMRPHYHLILFGAPIDDLTPNLPDYSKTLPNGKHPIYRKKSGHGEFLLHSEVIHKLWEKGAVHIEECSWNAAAYVSRYVMKKVGVKDKKLYDNLGILPEYLRMSTSPGIGAQWLKDNAEKLLRTDLMSVKTADGVNTAIPPRYFEKLMMKDPDSVYACLMELNKANRVKNARARCSENSSGKTEYELRQALEKDLQVKTHVLTRDKN